MFRADFRSPFLPFVPSQWGRVVKLCLAKLNEETRWLERKEFGSRFRGRKAGSETPS